VRREERLRRRLSSLRFFGGGLGVRWGKVIILCTQSSPWVPNAFPICLSGPFPLFLAVHAFLHQSPLPALPPPRRALPLRGDPAPRNPHPRGARDACPGELQTHEYGAAGAPL